jgi:hypothetical protein
MRAINALTFAFCLPLGLLQSEKATAARLASCAGQGKAAIEERRCPSWPRAPNAALWPPRPIRNPASTAEAAA